ncbi:MAG TPA: HlyD family secretion protein [Nitrospirae bacterium]|nr:HlyD family secretion protein [Nitrospirota bacterium]
MAKDNNATNNQRKRMALLVFALVVLAGLIAGFFYVRYKKTHISTDDAFVEGTIHTVASRVTGTVLKVYVSDNEFVKKGSLLVELDGDLYQRALRKAEAAWKAEQGRLEEIEASIDVQKKKIELARASLEKAGIQRKALESAVQARRAEVKAKGALLEKARKDLQRAEALYKKQVIPEDRLETARTSYSTAEASYLAAKALLRESIVALKGQDATIREAEAGLQAEERVLDNLNAALRAQRENIARRKAEAEIARLNLSYTKIYAPDDGYVTRKAVEVGNQVQAGQPLMALVSLDDVYIIANYKETKLDRIRPGQRVKIKVDAYPEKTFWGRVHSIMAGTGAAFSLFPPENATGNYVKVVQRVPVKILLEDGTDPGHILRIGMSVIPTVLTNE